MYKYKHNKTGEVIETANKVTSKNWTEIEGKQITKPDAGAKTDGKKDVGKKVDGKKTGTKQEPGKEADNR